MNDSHQNELSSILITKTQNWNHSWSLHLQLKGVLKTALMHTNIVHRKLVQP